MYKIFIIAIFTICCVGCQSIPFKELEETPVRMTDTEIIDNHKQSCPRSYQQLTTAVFSFFGREASSMGFVDVNQDTDSVSVAIMSQVGVKLIEIVFKNGKLHSSYVIPQIAEHGDIAEYIAQDLRSVYLNQIPSNISNIEREKTDITIYSEIEDEENRYTFSGERAYLTEKRDFEDGKLLRTVNFYEHKQIGKKVFPQGIILRNNKFNYKLTIRVKQLL